MAEVSKRMRADPDRVFEIIADGWTYASWVVGASHIRDVDANWPAPGSRIHHAVGPWPLVIRDTTTVREMTPGKHLLMRARIWPAGEADIDLRLEPDEVGTLVTMTETPVHGPLRYLGPVADAMLKLRNTESLERLAAQAEHRPRSA